MFAEANVGHRLKNRSKTIKISKKSESGVGDRQRRNSRFAGNKDHTQQAREDSPVDVIIQKRGKRDYAGRAEAFNSNERKNLQTRGYMGEKRTLRENSLVHGVHERKSSHRQIKKSHIDESSRKICSIVPRSIWVSSGTHDANLERKGTCKMKKRTFSPAASDRKMNGEGRTAKRVGTFEMNRDHIDLLNKNSKSKLSEKKIKGSVTKGANETLRDKKVMDDSEDKNNEPKRRKRIRLDPNDISNKRLDDGISFDESVKKKKEDGEKDDNLSKNAQFRAIQPSPSILSFVEENLLGRRREIELQRSGFNTDLSAPLDNIPFSTGPDRERIEESVFRNKLTFFAAAKVATSFPPPGLPEIAFAGRSNVGKSSLLNALTRQWGVVRTSDKPGLTQTINFFQLGSKLSLVDLPGYGFAFAKEEVKDAWEELVKEYVSTRVGLKRVCLLIDTKWGIKPRDHELIELMERSKTKYQVVLTKTDTVFPMDVARRAMQIEENLGAKKSIVQPLMMVSSKSGAGIRSLRSVLANIGRFARI